jgi:hypothetical protein
MLRARRRADCPSCVEPFGLGARSLRLWCSRRPSHRGPSVGSMSSVRIIGSAQGMYDAQHHRVRVFGGARQAASSGDVWCGGRSLRSSRNAEEPRTWPGEAVVIKDIARFAQRAAAAAVMHRPAPFVTERCHPTQRLTRVTRCIQDLCVLRRSWGFVVQAAQNGDQDVRSSPKNSRAGTRPR